MIENHLFKTHFPGECTLIDGSTSKTNWFSVCFHKSQSPESLSDHSLHGSAELL